MSLGRVDGFVNPATIGEVSNALDEVAEGITARGSVGIAEAENAFQAFSQQDIAGLSTAKSFVINPAATYPTPSDGYRAMMQQHPQGMDGFSNIVNQQEVNKYLNDPRFRSADALASCSNNLLGGNGIVDNLLGQNGLLAPALGGVQLPAVQRTGGERGMVIEGGTDPNQKGMIIDGGLDANQKGWQLTVQQEAHSGNGIVTGLRPDASINIKDPDRSAMGNELARAQLPGFVPEESFDPILSEYGGTSPGGAQGCIIKVPERTGITTDNKSIRDPGDISSQVAFQSKMDSFDGMLNLDPYSSEGMRSLGVFNEQLRALSGFEGVVKEQVGLDQQLQNFQNFQGGKIFG